MADKEIAKVEKDALLLVDAVVKIAYEKSCDGDWSALDDISIFKKMGYFWLYQAISETILRNVWQVTRMTEKRVYEWFKNNYKNVLGESYELVKRKNNPHHQPDFWLMHKGEYIPVECKVEFFTKAGLKQLSRYMDFYKASKGIAVARGLKCELPKNIKFINYEAQHG